MHYVAHITSVIDRMATVYSSFHGSEPAVVKAAIICRVNSTMRDRVNVNSAVVRELKEQWGRDLVELNCNLHPLDGFANEIKNALKKLDGDMGMPNTGRDCCASNFLYTLSKLR